VLETPFNEHSLQEIVYLLRFLYVPSDATPANLQPIADQHLPGVLRLAHKLNAPALLAAADKALVEKVRGDEEAGSGCRWLSPASWTPRGRKQSGTWG